MQLKKIFRRSSRSHQAYLLMAGVIGLPFTSQASTPVVNQGYYRAPSLADSTLVYSAEGDLWVTQLGSKSSRRLTSHPALEVQALISPDAQTVAFVANYTGTREIYTLPVSGGVPKRITFDHANITLQQWLSPNELLYSSTARPGPPTNWTLKRVNIETLINADIPLSDAFSGNLDPASGHLFFVQFGIQVSGDNTNFYRGGMRGKLWRYNTRTQEEAVPLLMEHNANISAPFVFEDRVYFLSDASGRNNLWSAAFDGSDLNQITQYTEWSIREASPAAGVQTGKVVYRVGADLYLHDLRSPSAPAQKLPISLSSDHPELRPRWIKTPLESLTSAHYTGELNKVLLTARGKMAVAGIDKSRLVLIGTPTHSRERDGHLSPDGQWVYTLSDRSGEVEVWQIAANGSDRAEQLTRNLNQESGGFKANLQLSATGRWLSFTDELGSLWLLDTKSKKAQRVVPESDYFDPFGPLGWSADDSHFAVAHIPANTFRPRILLYRVSDGHKAYVTSGKYISRAPQFSPDGQWLYYLSERNFTPSPANPWLDRDFGTAFNKRTEVFANALTADAHFPFNAPTELILAAERARENKETESKKKFSEKEDTKKALNVDWEGLETRLYQVPIPADSYTQLKLNNKRLYLVSTINDSFRVQTTEISSTPKLKTFADGISSISLSPDGEKLFAFKPDKTRKKPRFMIVPAGEKLPGDLTNKTVQTNAWQFQILPRDEWRQMFHDAWLMHREMFFDADMRGVNWVSIKNKYTPLLERITARDELNDIFKQMMGELNALHSQVYGGDYPKDNNASIPGMLGAVLENATRRGKAAGVTIKHIYDHDPEQPSLAPPLAKAQVDAQAGDVIRSVNGINVANLSELYGALQNNVGKQVLLELKRGRRNIQTVVVPNNPMQESQLRYQDWVAGNQRRVEQTDASLGYLHLQSMIGRDVSNFVKNFYASPNKQGMIIDVRRNNGGNVDSWLLHHLMRKLWAFWQPRLGSAYPNMQRVYRGHLVVLADERTYSDGETFTAGIKQLGLADVIGRRTAGAGVWLTDRNRLVDGGATRVAELPVFDTNGQWVIEGHGVSPTIEVINYPKTTYDGTDAQLEAAITYLQDRIKQQPVFPLKAKPFPEGLAPASDVPAKPQLN